MRALEGMRVGISGAIPDPAELGSHGWSDFDIRITVLRCVEHILRDGGRIVHGSHPSFAPIIRTATDTQSNVLTTARPVEMFVVAPYLRDGEEDELRRLHGKYANLHFVGPFVSEDSDERAALQDQARTKMRHQFIKMADALVCVGGRGERSTVKKPGVQEEVEFAVKAGKPIYLAAGVGGFTQTLRQALSEIPENGLSRRENELLETSADPGEIVNLIGKGLRFVWRERRSTPH